MQPMKYLVWARFDQVDGNCHVTTKIGAYGQTFRTAMNAFSNRMLSTRIKWWLDLNA